MSGSVGRYARHTKPQLLQAIREIVLYKLDMATDGASPGVWYNSPIWSFADGADQYVSGDVKIPINRVLGTPIKVIPVMSVVGAAGGVVALRLDYYTVAIGESMSQLTQISDFKKEIMHQITEIVRGKGFTILPAKLDYKPGGDIQFAFHAVRNDPSDTNTGTLYLLKLIFEYTAYV